MNRMKKLFLILLMSASLFSEAQYYTSNTKDMSSCDGVVYFLPRNVLKVELTVQETDYYVGPYAEYAKSVFGSDDYIKENKKTFSIQGADVQVFSQADPEASYCVWLDDKSKDGTLDLSMTDDGVILSFGDKVSTEGSDISYMAVNQYSELSETDKSEVHFMNYIGLQHEPEENEDGEVVSPKELTKEDKAKMIVENINDIRNLYRELVSGFQEVSYGSTLNDMATKTKLIEDEYVSLFVGKKETHIYKKVFYITPKASDKNGIISVAKISENEGVMDVSAKSGSAIKIQFSTSEPIASNITNTGSDTEKTIFNNKLFYRIPAFANAKITCGNDILAEYYLKISQFGETLTIPINGYGIVFNPNTGQVVKIKK